MLKNLIKYDLKWVYKALIVFYILSLVFSCITRILSSIEGSTIFYILAQISSGVTIAMMINCLVNNILRMWARFIRNTYKDESYLTHTLPVDKKTIYLSKVLSAIITIFTTTIVILACLAISYYSQGNMQILKDSLNFAAVSYDSTVISFLFVIFAVLFLEIVYILLVGYVGIVLGHKSNNGRMMKSIIYGFVLYLGTSALSVLLIFVLGLFNSNVMDIFNTTDTVDISAVKIIIYFAMAIYMVYSIACYQFGKKQLEKGVNID